MSGQVDGSATGNPLLRVLSLTRSINGEYVELGHFSQMGFLVNGSYTGFEFDRYTTNVSPIVLSLEYTCQITHRDLTYTILKRSGFGYGSGPANEAKGLELALLEAQPTAPCALRPALLCCMIRTVKQVAWGCSGQCESGVWRKAQVPLLRKLVASAYKTRPGCE